MHHRQLAEEQRGRPGRRVLGRSALRAANTAVIAGDVHLGEDHEVDAAVLLDEAGKPPAALRGVADGHDLLDDGDQNATGFSRVIP